MERKEAIYSKGFDMSRNRDDINAIDYKKIKI